MALTDKLTAIADAIRSRTGKTAEMTLDQMVAEIAGIETGGSGLAYDMGEFVLDAECQFLGTDDSGIYHGLGEVPQFVLIWTEDFADLNADNVSPYSNTTMVGYVFFDGLFQLDQRLTSTASAAIPVWAGFTLAASGYTVAVGAGTASSYNMQEGEKPTSEKLGLSRSGNNCFWRTGVTYKYFVSKAWWEVTV